MAKVKSIKNLLKFSIFVVIAAVIYFLGTYGYDYYSVKIDKIKLNETAYIYITPQDKCRISKQENKGDRTGHHRGRLQQIGKAQQFQQPQTQRKVRHQERRHHERHIQPHCQQRTNTRKDNNTLNPRCTGSHWTHMQPIDD